MPTITRRFIAGLVTAVLLVAVAFINKPFRASATSTNTSVIVELKGDAAAVYVAKAQRDGQTPSDNQIQAYRDQLRAAQDSFLAELSASGQPFELQSVTVGNVKIEKRYTMVYDGLALNVPASAIPAIKAMSRVKAVHPNTVFQTTLNKSVPYIRAPEVYGDFAELTQFDDLREGYEGQGMYIAVIDTGIDWTHPMFGADPTPPRLGVAPVSTSVPTNQKVVYSLPLTDAVTDGFGHGTHVASTAAGWLAFAPGPDGLPGTADDIPIHGVAPQAKLMSYKVCSDGRSTVSQVVSVGGCETSNIIMAIEDAVSPFTVTGFAKPKAHVINMSLGGGGGPDEPTAIASDNAVKLGTTVVAAAGNSGPDEATLGAPAAGSRVIAVAADTDPGSRANWSVDVLAPTSFSQSTLGAVTPANNMSSQSAYPHIKLYPMAGTPPPPDNSMAQYYTLIDNPLVSWPATVRGRIALINNSGAVSATFFDICNQAVAAGAVGVLLNSTVTTPTAVRCSVPSANILAADAATLMSAMVATGTPTNGTLSRFPIRMNPDFSFPFVGETAIFSSRGPVQGFGQVKPDISAPGVNILAAMPPASLLGALAQGNYGAISGTSMATPHVAGAATLVKQAHLGWNPDMIRTALINTATNMRDITQSPKAGGLNSESINDQGGGLIDVYEAVNAKALMGVAGDGVSAPTILGSHSYGEVPVVDSRITYTKPVTVTIRDLSGQGGTYRLSIANSRDLQLSGVGANTNTTSVSVPANGTATFTVNATVDGNAIRSVLASKVNGATTTIEPIQMQWYVTATRTDGAETLRMPFYLKPAPSLPASPNVTPQSFSGIVPVGDAGVQLIEGVTYVDIPFNVSPGTYRIEARLDYTAQEVEDMDFYLYGPDGQEVTHSAIGGGPEQFGANVTKPGTYTYRIVGFTNGPVQYTVSGNLFAGPAAPTLQPIAGEFVDAQGRSVDFNGCFTLAWQPEGHERGFEIERSTDGGQTWSLIASPAAGTTSLALKNQPDGTLQYRIHGLQDGQIGFYVTPAGAAQSIFVDHRSKVNITNQVQTAIADGTLSFTGGVVQFNLTLANQSANAYLPLVQFNITRVSSSSGSVAVINADNNGDGKSKTTAALYDYSRQLGSDEIFSAGEVTGARTMRFRNPASELFTFDACITAYRGNAGSGASEGADTTAPGGAPPSESITDSLLSGASPLLRFTVNPLTGTVGVQVIQTP